MEAAALAIAIAIGVARALFTRRHRKATRTVARALRGVHPGTEARFARYPRGRWGR